MTAEHVGRPLIEGGAIERTLPRNGCHTPTSARASDRLARSARPITPSGAGREREGPLARLTFWFAGARCRPFADNRLDGLCSKGRAGLTGICRAAG